MKRVAEHGRGVVAVPVIVEPVVVRLPATLVPVPVPDVQVVVRRVAECAERHLCHHPSSTLRVESYSASQCPSASHQVSSFLKFLHTPLRLKS